MINIAIIGAGMAGIALSNLLKNKMNVSVFEKSRGVGGRMATRRADPFQFNHGAQYFKIKNKDFKDFLNPLFEQNIIKPWLANFVEIRDKTILKREQWTKNTKNYVGLPKMNSILKYFIQNLPINLSCKIEKIKRNIKSWNLYDTEGNCYGPFDYVVLTTPPRQTEALLHENFKYTDIIRKIIMRSCFSIMLGFSKDKRLEFDAALFHDEDLAWLSVNKTFSNKQAYYNILINSSYDFAENNKNYSTDRIFNHLTQKVSNILNFNYDNYNYKAVHYWRYAMCEKINNYGSFFDDNLSLLVCGDWCMAGNVEGAFLSALDAAKKLKTYL